MLWTVVNKKKYRLRVTTKNRSKSTINARTSMEELSVTTRFTAASNEINQRINARQMSYLYYVTASAAIFTILADKLKTHGDTPREVQVLIVIGPAIISLAFGCWIRAQDLTIGMLSTFCRICEKITRDERETKPSKSLEWHQGWWQINSMRHRRWVEIAFFLLNSLLVVLLALYAGAWPPCQRDIALATVFVAFFIFGLSSWTVLSIVKHRSWLTRLDFRNGAMWHGKIELPEEVWLDPNELMVVASAVGALFALLIFICSLLGFADHKICFAFGLLVLPLAAALRLLADHRDGQILWKTVNETRKLTRFWSPHWSVPIFAWIVSVLLLWLPKDNFRQWGLWIGAALLAYAIPELIVAERYHRLILTAANKVETKADRQTGS